MRIMSHGARGNRRWRWLRAGADVRLMDVQVRLGVVHTVFPQRGVERRIRMLGKKLSIANWCLRSESEIEGGREAGEEEEEEKEEKLR